MHLNERVSEGVGECTAPLSGDWDPSAGFARACVSASSQSAFVSENSIRGAEICIKVAKSGAKALWELDMPSCCSLHNGGVYVGMLYSHPNVRNQHFRLRLLPPLCRGSNKCFLIKQFFSFCLHSSGWLWRAESIPPFIRWLKDHQGLVNNPITHANFPCFPLDGVKCQDHLLIPDWIWLQSADGAGRHTPEEKKKKACSSVLNALVLTAESQAGGRALGRADPGAVGEPASPGTKTGNEKSKQRASKQINKGREQPRSDGWRLGATASTLSVCLTSCPLLMPARSGCLNYPDSEDAGNRNRFNMKHLHPSFC